MTRALATGPRSGALRAHDEAAERIERMLAAAGAAVGDWRPALDELRATAEELEAEANRVSALLDDDAPEEWGAF